MNRLESKIRDFLALNISFLCEDFVLVEKEFPLNNPDGAGGSIDLLAKDKFGHFVIIELKRSDQSARAALHELAKYTALLKSQMGLRRDQLRVILVSSEWHELAVPFTEYLETCVIPTEGVHIIVDSDGRVLSKSPFIPVDLSKPLMLSRQQDILFFESSFNRDSSLARVVDAAHSARLTDFAVLGLDYRGGSSMVIYPHGLYLVFSSPIEAVDEMSARKIKESFEWDGELDDLDENFLVAFREALGAMGDESGIGYPEKLAKIESDGWQVAVLHRAGRYAGNTDLVPDMALISEAKKTEGGAAYYFAKVASPRFKPAWMKLKEDSKLVLLGDAKWGRIVSVIFQEIEAEDSSASVSVSIYNLANIVFGLTKLFSSNDQSYLPTLQVVVECVGETRVYLGALAWTGQVTALEGTEWLRICFGTEDKYMLSQHFGNTYEVDDFAKKKVGLGSYVLEIRHAGSKDEVIQLIEIKSGKLVRKKMADIKLRSLSDFNKQNDSFGRSLVNWAARSTTGWV